MGSKKMGVLDLMFVVGLDLNTFGNPCLRLMVAEAELLILGIRPAMLHIFIWDTILGCWLPPYYILKLW